MDYPDDEYEKRNPKLKENQEKYIILQKVKIHMNVYYKLHL